jgi:hypothetical protein
MRWLGMMILGLSLVLSVGAEAKGNKNGGNKKGPTPPSRGTNQPAAASKTSSVPGGVPDSEKPQAAAASASSGQGSAAPTPKGPTRIDFDDRLVEGQSNKSGAVYLYDRKDLQVDSMVKQPSTYREEIARGLLE